jgi:hypothetical protein
VKYALLCAALADGQAWFVRSVRSRTAVTQELVGRPIRFEELEAARRSSTRLQAGASRSR